MGKFPHEIDDMPLSDFYECMIYEQIEPFGGRRGDLQAGIVAATIANIYRDTKAKLISPMDFVPTWDGPPQPKQQSPEKQLEIMTLIQAMQNAKVNNA